VTLRTLSFDPRARQVWTLPALLFVSAALLLIHQSWSMSLLGRMLLVRGMTAHWPHAATFLINWTLMCCAMMLPTSLGLLAATRQLWSAGRETVLSQAFVTLGFITVWMISGALLVLFSFAIVQWPNLAAALHHFSQLLSGGAIIVSGMYLLSPFARHCLTACRSPMSFIATQSGRGPIFGQALMIGWAYGKSCFGCCWPLMVVMAVFGLHSLGWMLMATVFMAYQKQGRMGDRVMRLTGSALMAFGLIMACGLSKMERGSDLAMFSILHCAR
jgi:predicted metal-binding membrane protein